MHAAFLPSNIFQEYLEALKNHCSTRCNSCFHVHVAEGAAFCRELQDELARTLDKVNNQFLFGFLTLTDFGCLCDLDIPRQPEKTAPVPNSSHFKISAALAESSNTSSKRKKHSRK